MKKFLKVLLSAFIILGVLVSGFLLELKLNEYRKAESITTKISTEVRDGRNVDWDELDARNNDVKGWIWLEGTAIDYPVVQAANNDFYLHRDLDQNYLYDGSIFIDSEVERPFKDFNTVVYGHHMQSGAMFAALAKYADKEFFDKHRTIVLETYEKSYDLKVIAYLNEPSDSPIYDTHFSDGNDGFEEELDIEGGALTKQDFISLVKEKAVHKTNEEFSEDDALVTLSTCAYNYDEARHQVVGVLRDAGDKQVVIKEEKFRFNKWLLAQIGVAIVMAYVAIMPFRRKRGEE